MNATDVKRERGMERARAKARQLRLLYQHVVTYALVMALLVVIDLVNGTGEAAFLGLDWAYWPAAGWGLFVVMHAVSVSASPDDWERRKAQELYDRERRGDEPGR